MNIHQFDRYIKREEGKDSKSVKLLLLLLIW